MSGEDMAAVEKALLPATESRDPVAAVGVLLQFMREGNPARLSFGISICMARVLIGKTSAHAHLALEVIKNTDGLQEVFSLMQSDSLDHVECGARLFKSYRLITRHFERFLLRSWTYEGFLSSVVRLLSSTEDMHKFVAACVLSDLSMHLDLRWWEFMCGLDVPSLLTSVLKHPFSPTAPGRHVSALEVVLSMWYGIKPATSVYLLPQLGAQFISASLLLLQLDVVGVKSPCEFQTHLVQLIIQVCVDISKHVDVSLEIEAAAEDLLMCQRKLEDKLNVQGTPNLLKSLLLLRPSPKVREHHFERGDRARLRNLSGVNSQYNNRICVVQDALVEGDFSVRVGDHHFTAPVERLLGSLGSIVRGDKKGEWRLGKAIGKENGVCSNCRSAPTTGAREFKKCGRCLLVQYCTPFLPVATLESNTGKQHWKATLESNTGHKAECKKLAELLKHRHEWKKVPPWLLLYY
jgi:hypothetical protein